MAVPSRSPGLVGETPQRTLLRATVWFMFEPGVAWYSFSSGPPLYRYLSNSGSTSTHITAHGVVGLSCSTISGGHAAKAILCERHAAVEAVNDVRKTPDLQGREHTALGWRP